MLAAKRERAKFRKKPKTPTTGNKTITARNKAYRNKYRGNPVYSRARSYDSRTYYDRRDRYLSSWDRPTYVYNMSPSYGLLDTVILVSMLNNMNHASAYAYHNQNNADYRAWRREMDLQARENAELRRQLAEMDRKVAAMEGTPVNPGYVPEGMDADLLLSKEARESQTPEMRVCVGGSKGAYYRIASTIMSALPTVTIVPVTTSGTPEILQKIANGECDAGFAQSDGYWNYIEEHQTTVLPFERVTSTHKEAVHLVCNTEVDGDSIKDLDEEHTIYFPRMSGAATTFRNWLEEDSSYGSIRTVFSPDAAIVDNNSDALMKAATEENSCMMYVAAPGATSLIQEAEQLARNGRVKLMNVDDWDFNDTEDPAGKEVYTFGKLDPEYYPNLLKSAGFFGKGSVEVPYLNADFLVSTAWKQKHSRIYSDVALGILGLQPEIFHIMVVK